LLYPDCGGKMVDERRINAIFRGIEAALFSSAIVSGILFKSITLFSALFTLFVSVTMFWAVYKAYWYGTIEKGTIEKEIKKGLKGVIMALLILLIVIVVCIILTFIWG
jgi:hypothetical protein